MELWPQALPTYQIDEATQSIKLSVIADPNPGESQQRRVGNKDLVTLPATFRFSMVQSEIFGYFISTLCNDGLDWFLMPVLRAGQVSNLPVRLVDGDYSTQHDGLLVTVNCQLEYYR
jgi:hypothetical protein